VAQSRIPLARDGYPMLGGVFGAAVVAFAAGALLRPSLSATVATVLGVLLLALGGFLLNFFRDPERTAPSGEGLVVSPADGRVLLVEPEVDEARFLSSRAAKISIFMSPLDVHVNRAPIDGEVTAVHYNHGKYLAAFSDKASLENEQNAIVMAAADGRSIAFIQIAGMVARRIVCRVAAGDRLRRGERVGMIKLGSRVDIFLPGRVTLRVRAGDRVSAGVTVLGVLT